MRVKEDVGKANTVTSGGFILMTGWNYVGGRVDLLGDVISGIETQRKYNNLGKGEHSGI